MSNKEVTNTHFTINDCKCREYQNKYMSVPLIQIYCEEESIPYTIYEALSQKYYKKLDIEKILSPHPISYRKPRLEKLPAKERTALSSIFKELREKIDLSFNKGRYFHPNIRKDKKSKLDLLLREVFYKASLVSDQEAIKNENIKLINIIKGKEKILLQRPDLIKTYIFIHHKDKFQDINKALFAFANHLNGKPKFLFHNDQINTENIIEYMTNIMKQPKKISTLKTRPTREKLFPPIPLYKEKEERTSWQDVRMYSLLSYNLLALSKNVNIYKETPGQQSPGYIILNALKKLNQLNKYLIKMNSHRKESITTPNIDPNFLEPVFKLFNNIPNTGDYLYGTSSEPAVTVQDIKKSLEHPIRTKPIKTNKEQKDFLEEDSKLTNKEQTHHSIEDTQETVTNIKEVITNEQSDQTSLSKTDIVRKKIAQQLMISF